jgi:hypothetical protein
MRYWILLSGLLALLSLAARADETALTNVYCSGSMASASSSCLAWDGKDWWYRSITTSSLEGTRVLQLVPLKLVQGSLDPATAFFPTSPVLFEGHGKDSHGVERDFIYGLQCGKHAVIGALGVKGTPIWANEVYTFGPYPNHLPLKYLNESWWPAQIEQWKKVCPNIVP